MRLIAHRGFAATAPENTIAAVQSAADHADAVEFDVQRCGSGELVVIHDDTIDRVTGTSAPSPTSVSPISKPTPSSSRTSKSRRWRRCSLHFRRISRSTSR